jgi:hypothetical protein
MTPERRRTPRVLAALAFAGMMVLGGTQAASAIGWSPVVNCSGGGILSGRSYEITFSNAGGNTYLDNGCGGTISSSGLQLRYQVYPGGPYALTSQRVQQGGVTSLTQAGTANGYHKAYNSGGGQVCSTNS